MEKKISMADQTEIAGKFSTTDNELISMVSDKGNHNAGTSEITSQFRFIGHRLLFLKERKGDVEQWQDVPEHFGRFYPASIELPRGVVASSGEGQWFADQLESIFRSSSISYKISARSPMTRKSRALFVNCLDPVFGHALYKLSAAQALTHKYPEYDIVVLISRNLSDYAAFAPGAIVVEESLSKLLYPSVNLMNTVLSYASEYNEFRWAFCNTSRLGDQQVLPSAMYPHQFPKSHGVVVTYIHRDDRTWGLTKRMQIWRVNRVFKLLKRKFPSVETAVIGIGFHGDRYEADHSHVTSQYQSDFEKQLAELSMRSVCIFGVHGSHMLVPSYYAQATVELQHYSRLGNAVQAFWPNPQKSIHEILFGYRVLYGGWRLWNIPASVTFKIIDSIVMGLPGLKARMDSNTILGVTKDEAV